MFLLIISTVSAYQKLSLTRLFLGIYRNLVIPGYHFIGGDHLHNVKRETVCIYCKSFILLKVRSIQYIEGMHFRLRKKRIV